MKTNHILLIALAAGAAYLLMKKPTTTTTTAPQNVSNSGGTGTGTAAPAPTQANNTGNIIQNVSSQIGGAVTSLENAYNSIFA